MNLAGLEFVDGEGEAGSGTSSGDTEIESDRAGGELLCGSEAIEFSKEVVRRRRERRFE